MILRLMRQNARLIVRNAELKRQADFYFNKGQELFDQMLYINREFEDIMKMLDELVINNDKMRVVNKKMMDEVLSLKGLEGCVPTRPFPDIAEADKAFAGEPWIGGSGK